VTGAISIAHSADFCIEQNKNIVSGRVMNWQPSFPGITPRGTDHIYFALVPEERAASLINGSTLALSRALGLRGSAVPAERLHLSLHWLGDTRSESLLAMADRAAGVVAGIAPFDVSFDRIATFRSGREHPLVLLCGKGGKHLHAFHMALAEAIRQAAPCQYEWRPFAPHITVLYDRCRVGERPVAPVSWTVRDFVLIHSLVGQARHVRLGRWPLKGAA
jgi:2'-5' RNA ligase